MATRKFLENSDYFIRENNTNNPYLNLNGLDDVVGSGFHSFYIVGSQYLRKGSEILFEVVDSQGNAVEINAVRSIRKGNARIVSFAIDDDVVNGSATLYVSAVLEEYLDSNDFPVSVPDEWNEKQNFLFSYNFTVDKDKKNSDDIIFRKRPRLSVIPQLEEVKKVNKNSITVSTGSGGNALTGSIVNSEQISQTEYLITFEADENTFNGEMRDGNIRFTSRKYTDSVGNTKEFSYINYERYPTDNGYEGDIQTVRDRKTVEAIFENPDITTFGSGQEISYVNTFIPENQDIIYEVDYTSIPYTEETLIQQGTYADITIRDLHTVSGDVELIRVYQKSNSQGTNYSLVFEGQVDEQSSLLEVIDNFNIGIFDSGSKLNYWTASDATNAGDLPTDGTPEFLLSEDLLLNGAVISGSNDVFTKDVSGNQLQKPLYSVESNTSFTLYKDVDYDISLNTAVENVIADDTRLDVYISGSGLPADRGNRFGELVHSFRTNADKKWYSDDFEITYSGDYTITDARVILVVTSGKWHVSDIEVLPQLLEGFTAGEYRTQIPLEVLRPSQDFDFKVEFFDGAGNKSNTVLYEDNVTFDRPNLVIEGDQNVLTGSMYAGGNSGSGIEFGGSTAGGSMRSIGYEGFISSSTGLSSPGFLIFSGSVLSGSGDNYRGVGLELVANSSSYFKYRTDPEELTVRTNNFFFGDPNSQFISGSGGNIEISSSIFHLDPSNDILIISGTINATFGNIGGFTISPHALTGNGFYLSGSATGNEYFISSSDFNVKANGDVTGSSVLFSGGKIGGFDLLNNEIKSSNNNLRLKDNGQITGSNVLFDGGKIGGFTVSDSFISSSNLIINSDGTISTANFASGVSGWQLNANGNGSAEFENVRIRGTLSTTVFEKETVNAVGGQLWVGNSTILTENVSDTETTMSVENVSSFENGEILLLKKVEPTGFTAEYVLVQSSSRDNAGSPTDFTGDLYVQRAYQSGSAVDVGVTWVSEIAGGAEAYNEGQVVVSTGKLDTGWILLNANPNETYTPYIDIVERTGSGVYDYDLKVRLGDLSGLTSTQLNGDNPSTAGFGLFSENVYLTGTIIANAGEIGGFTLNNDILSNNTFFISSSATGNEQFINANDNFIVRANGDLTASNADISGKITANTGSIGGFLITQNAISGDGFYLSGSATGNDFFISSSNFNVKANGDVTASNAFVSGSIYADDGRIGDWQIVDGKISGSNITLNANNSTIFKTDQGPGSDPQSPGFEYLADEYYIDFTPAGANSEGFYVKFGPNFSIDVSGNLFASGATFSGTITASSGQIGGFIIGSSSLYSPSNLFYLSGSATGNEFFISSSAFNVKANGDVTGSNVLFDGGKIGGWEIGDSYLSSSNLIINSNGTISTADFASGVRGWTISSQGNGSAQFENVKIRGTLQTTVFEKETINAVGGQLWVGNSTTLSASVSDTETTMSVVNVSGFETNEILLAKKVTPSGFNSEYILIESSSRTNPTSSTQLGGNLYVQRAYGSGSATGSDVTWVSELASNADSYTEGQVLVSTGKIDNGWILMNAAPNDAGYTPYMDIVERTGSGVYDYDLKVRLGDLSGLSQTRLLGVDPNNAGFGLYSENVFLTGGIRATFGEIGGFSIENDVLKSSGSDNFFLSGSATGNDFFISSSQFNVKANGNMTASNALIQGVINVVGGNAATQTYASTQASASASQAQTNANNYTNQVSASLTSSITNLSQSVSSSISNTSKSLSDRIVTDANNKIIKPNAAPVTGNGLYLASQYMGYYDSSDWTAYISSSGEFLFQKDADNLLSFGNNSFILNVSDEATISGSQINLVTPEFFFGQVGQQYISGSNGSLEISSSEFYLNNGNATFGGTLNAATGDFSGTITASAGEIGGFQIQSTQINDTGNNLILKANGQLTASDAFISGSVFAGSGLIGGWTVEEDRITNVQGGSGLILSSSISGEIEMVSSSRDVLSIAYDAPLPSITSADLSFTGSATQVAISASGTTQNAELTIVSGSSGTVSGFDDNKPTRFQFRISGSQTPSSLGVNWTASVQGYDGSWDTLRTYIGDEQDYTLTQTASLDVVGYSQLRVLLRANSGLTSGDEFEVICDNIEAFQYNPKMVINSNGIFLGVSPGTYLSLASGEDSGGGTTTPGVTSVFGRVGTVTAESGDYDFSLIAGQLQYSQFPSESGTWNADLSGGSLDIQTDTNPSNGGNLLRVLSSGGAERLRVEHGGTTYTDNDFEASGEGLFGGPVTASAADINGNADITGNTDIGGDVDIIGNIRMNGDIEASGSSFTFGNGSSTVNIGGGSNSSTINLGKGGTVSSYINWVRNGTVDSRIYSDTNENLIIGVDVSNVLGGKDIIFQDNGTEIARFNETNAEFSQDIVVSSSVFMSGSVVFPDDANDNFVGSSNAQIRFEGSTANSLHLESTSEVHALIDSNNNDTTSTFRISAHTENNNIFVVSQSGNVKITGTVKPLGGVSVESTTPKYDLFDTAGDRWRTQIGADNTTFEIYDVTSGAGASRLSITRQGNLSVNGTITTNGTQIFPAGQEQGVGKTNNVQFNNLTLTGTFTFDNVLLSNQENNDADVGTETVASITGSYDAAFFDFLIKSGSNLRSGTVYAVHDGGTVEFTEISTNDIGNTNDVELLVDVSGGNLRLRSTVSNTNNWEIKSLVRGI